MVEQKRKGVFRRAVEVVEGLELTDPLVEQLERKLTELGGVKGVLWDLDDHFLDTTTFIHGHLTIFVAAVVGITGLEHEAVWRVMKKHSDAAFGLYHVNPVRWEYVVAKMAEELGCSAGLLRPVHEELLTMYGKSPEMYPGAVTVLQLAKKLDLKVVWVTNANVDWTYAKFDRHNLWDYTDQLVIVDENRSKGVSDWWTAVRLAQLPPAQLLGGGDSREADLIPLEQIGVAGVIGVPPRFELAKNGHHPNGVMLIDSIAAWPEGVLGLVKRPKASLNW